MTIEHELDAAIDRTQQRIADNERLLAGKPQSDGCSYVLMALFWIILWGAAFAPLFIGD